MMRWMSRRVFLGLIGLCGAWRQPSLSPASWRLDRIIIGGERLCQTARIGTAGNGTNGINPGGWKGHTRVYHSYEVHLDTGTCTRHAEAQE